MTRASTEGSVARSRPRFARAVLKLSGESLCRPGGFGIDPDEVRAIAEQIRLAHEKGGQIAIVIGGGNIIRGARLAEAGVIPRATADEMGMLGTMINGLALREALQSCGVEAVVFSAIEARSVAQPFVRAEVARQMELGRVAILVAGTGHPFFSTDTCAALRAAELRAHVILKATKVDGVYTADPKRDASATRYERLGFDEAIERRLGVMDATAFALCRENAIPVVVFDFSAPASIARAMAGESIGTLVTPSA